MHIDSKTDLVHIDSQRDLMHGLLTYEIWDVEGNIAMAGE